MNEVIEDRIERWVSFVLSEARAESKLLKPQKYQPVDVALRQLSTLSVGLEGSSVKVKRVNRLVSTKAKEYLLQCKTFTEWHKATINEHQMPLSVVWSWILENCQTLTTEDVINKFREHPMVSILYSEDALLAKSTWSEDRYLSVGMTVETLDKTPIEYFK